MPSYEVTLLPRQHQFIASNRQSILKAGLESGLNLKYGCEDGNCGKCLARLLDGEIQAIRHADFVLTAAQKRDGYFLSCCHAAASELRLEMPEIGSAREIPEQLIQARVYRLQRLSDEVMSLTLKTPRSQQLGFLAGQYISLHLKDDLRCNLSIASCPCDGLKPEIHVQYRTDDPFSDYVFTRLDKNDPVTLHGPWGNFILDDDTPRELVFIAYNDTFASIKSLLEHLIALDKPQQIRLYWLLSAGHQAYLENYCRSISHALDNFNYRLMEVADDSVEDLSRALDGLFEQEQQLAQAEIFISLPQRYKRLAEEQRSRLAKDQLLWRIDDIPGL